MTKTNLALAGIAIIAICAAVYGFYHPRVIERAGETVVLPGKTIYRLRDCKTDGAKPLPGGDISLVSSNLPSAPNGGTILTMLSPSTGAVHNQFTPSARSFIAFENDKRIKLITNGTGGMLQAGWSFARIGNVYLSGEAMAWTISEKSGIYAGIGIEYRF